MSVHHVERLVNLVGLQQEVDVASQFGAGIRRRRNGQLLGFPRLQLQNPSAVTAAHDLGEGERRAVVEHRGQRARIHPGVGQPDCRHRTGRRLSRFRSLFVISRNSAFTYKGRAVDVRQVGRELGVRYLLEGSVRKAANRIRITGQLIETASAAHLWADRFDGTPEDIFDLQDQVTESVVGAISPALEQAEIDRIKRKPTESLGAYDYFLRGRAALHEGSVQGHKDALRLFYRAIELDPDFASAYGWAAYCYCHRKTNGWIVDREEEIAETARLARRAVELDKDDAVALSCGGFALAYVVGELDTGVAFIDRALLINPNLATAWIVSGWARVWLGTPELAIEHLERATRLSPLDPLIYRCHVGITWSCFFTGRFEEAIALATVLDSRVPESAEAIGKAVKLALATADDSVRGSDRRILESMDAGSHVPLDPESPDVVDLFLRGLNDALPYTAHKNDPRPVRKLAEHTE